jgi:hypothetical protein
MTEATRYFIQSLVVAVTPILLLSVGGEGVVASPVLVAALWWGARSRPPKPLWVIEVVLGALSTMLGIWGLVYYSGLGDVPRASTILPILGGIGAAVVFSRTTSPGLHRTEDSAPS